MSLPAFRTRLPQIAPLMFATISALIIVLYPIFDYDLYWHLANGREMVNSGRIIGEEVFSYTHFGEKFENHEWLTQIIFYLIWQSVGPYGLLGLKLLITALVVLLCYRTALMVGGQPWLAALLCVFAVLAGFYRYIERPELFSLLNIALVSFILYGYRAGRLSQRALWFIPLILVIWNSLHGAIYGLGLLTVFVACENAKHIIPALQREAGDGRAWLSKLNLCYAIVIVAMLIDPYGLRTYGIFFGYLRKETMPGIVELMPITSNWREYIPYLCLLAWAVLFALRHIRRIDFTQLVLLAVFGIMSLRHARITGVASIILIPIIANLMSITARQAVGRAQQIQVTAIMLAAAIFVSGYACKVKFVDQSPQALGYQLDDELYFPVGTVRFIKAIGLQGNYYNTGNLGGYLSYHAAPERKIFQYNMPLFLSSDSSRVSVGNMSRWDFNYAILGDPFEISTLFPVDQWARIYRDPGAVLVLRRSMQNQPIIQRYELRFFHPMMQDDAVLMLARDSRSLPRLAEEMGNYLAFRKDARIAGLWAEILIATPSLLNSSRIQSLLQQALKYNSNGKLARFAS